MPDVRAETSVSTTCGSWNAPDVLVLLSCSIKHLRSTYRAQCFLQAVGLRGVLCPCKASRRSLEYLSRTFPSMEIDHEDPEWLQACMAAVDDVEAANSYRSHPSTANSRVMHQRDSAAPRVNTNPCSSMSHINTSLVSAASITSQRRSRCAEGPKLSPGPVSIQTGSRCRQQPRPPGGSARPSVVNTRGGGRSSHIRGVGAPVSMCSHEVWLRCLNSWRSLSPVHGDAIKKDRVEILQRSGYPVRFVYVCNLQ